MDTFILALRTKKHDHREQVEPLVEEHDLSVEWVEHYPIEGEYDAIHVLRAEDIEVARRLATLIRSEVGAYTELWPVVAGGSDDEGRLPDDGKPSKKQRVNEALEESFPASDPPSFTPEK